MKIFTSRYGEVFTESDTESITPSQIEMESRIEIESHKEPDTDDFSLHTRLEQSSEATEIEMEEMYDNLNDLTD